MPTNSTLTDIPQTMAHAAFGGDSREVIRSSSDWLRRFSKASYAMVATSTGGRISDTCHSGSIPEYVATLRALPVGRGTIFVDDDGLPRAIFADDRRPEFARPDRALAHFIGLPMYDSDAVGGMAYVSRPIQQGQYSWREQLCMCAYVSEITSALEIARSTRQHGILNLNDEHSFAKMVDELGTFLPYDKPDLEKALSKTTTELSALAHVDAAHVYLPAPHGLLVPSNRWHNTDDSRFKPFLEATERSVFTVGHGLPGRVLTSQRSSWISDVSADLNFPRVYDALPVGIRSAAAFPVRHNNRITAVVECFFTNTVNDDPVLLSHIESVLTN